MSTALAAMNTSAQTAIPVPRTYHTLTEKFHNLAMPRNAQKNQRLVDRDTLPDTVNHSTRDQLKTGCESANMGKVW